MNTDNRIVNRLFRFVAVAVALIALGSFTLSFMALFAVATGNGVPAGLGWIWPLIVDVSMIIYTAAILVAQLQSRPARLPVGLTVFYSVVTVTGNLLHAPATPLGWFVAALPPLSLILGTEMLRAMAHHNILENQAIVTLAELSQQAADLSTTLDMRRAELNKLDRQIEQAAARLDDMKQRQVGEISRNVHDLNAKRQAKIQERRQEVISLLGQGQEPKEMAAALKVGIKTIRRDIAVLNGKVAEVSK